jgi:formyl-CoA transferase
LPTEPDRAAPAALSGVRVLELATLNAGPTLGALRDDFRALGQQGGKPGLWNLTVRNKRAVTLDYRQDEGRELLARMTAVADVVLLNQPVSLLERIGCTYKDIAGRNPRAVVVYVSGWGADGPYRDLTGNGTLGEAFAGLTDHQRGPAGAPRLSAVLFGDHLTALAGMIGTLAALYWRDANGGRGQFVDVALYEAVLGLLGAQLVSWTPPDPDPTGRPAGPPARSGPGIRDTFPTADGRWVTVTSYSANQIARLLEAVGVGVPEGDGEEPDLTGLVRTWLAGVERETALAAFREARIGIAPVNDLADLMADPHATARGAVVEIDDPALGPVRLPGPFPRLSATPAEVRWVARELGADNAAVYPEWLGLDPAELDRLGADGII